MTTRESPVARAIYDQLASKIGRDRLAYGGSVPNLATELPHSYHRSWQDSPHDRGYSVAHSGDRAPAISRAARQYACAVDLTFHDPSDMRKATARLHHWATTSRANWSGLVHSPILREFAGTLDGRTVFAMDTSGYRSPMQTFGWDDSHLWHVHLSINRWRILHADIVPVIVAAFGDW